MSTRCAVCGAILPEGSTCQTIHDELLSFELLHTILHSIHFLHVTCFLIQHEHYSDEGLIWAQSLLSAHLEQPLTEERHRYLLRTEGKRRTSGARTWTFTRMEDARPLPRIAWALTIVDVAQQRQTAQLYSEYVMQWARTTLQQMAAL